MSTLSDFLTARLDDDEAAAKTASPGPWRVTLSAWVMCDEPGPIIGKDSYVAFTHSDENRAHVARHDPARVLREVEAKRAIVAAREALVEPDPIRAAALDFALGRLAAVYADHPDYRQEWKP